MKTNKGNPIKTALILGVIFLFALAGNAQNVEFKKNNFPGQKTELKRAVKEIKRGDELLGECTRGAYAEALTHYLEANHFNPRNAALNFKIGVCYYESYERGLALKHLETARELDSAVTNRLWLYLAESYQFHSRFTDALNFYDKYAATLGAKELENEKALIEKRKAECESGMKLKANPNIIQFDRLTEKVNSRYDEYCPVIDENETIMAFTSRRKSSVGERINPLDGLYFEDIYFTYKDLQKAWDYPENPGQPLNGKANDATVEISHDGKILTVYKNIKGRDFICESENEGGKWQKPVKLASEINRTSCHQPSAAFSSDRKMIFYVSDQKGGFGGSDIYYSKILPDGSWSPSVNLGARINSPYDEEAPFLFQDSTLYYSSKGFNGMGGYDVFVSKLGTDGQWSAPVNMGVPLNSPGDDLYLVVSPSGESYVSSDRIDGYGGFDIYHVKLNLNVNDLMAAVPPVFVHGKVTDEKSQEGVFAMVDIHGRAGSNLVPGGKSDSLGVFVAGLPSMRSYEMTIEPLMCDSVVTKANLVSGTLYHPMYAITGTDSIPRTKIRAQIKDYRTGRPLQFPVEITDMENQVVAVRAMPDADGYFSVELPSASSYQFHVYTNACAHQPVVASLPDNYRISDVDGMRVNLENVYFDFDRSDLRTDAIEILTRHSALFSRFSNWKIVVGGHTDNMGSEEYNMFLSEQRARVVADYLISKGVKKNQLKVEWYGYDRPVTSNQSEEGRQLNRRVEFSVVKF